jgi:hypothetical protein
MFALAEEIRYKNLFSKISFSLQYLATALCIHYSVKQARLNEGWGGGVEHRIYSITE